MKLIYLTLLPIMTSFSAAFQACSSLLSVRARDIVCHAVKYGRCRLDHRCPYKKYQQRRQTRTYCSALQNSVREEDDQSLEVFSTVTSVKRKPQVGDVVTIDFDLKPDGDFVAEPLFDMHGEQTFVLGGGNYLPGIHELVEGMEEGQSVSRALIDAGWGERNPELVAELKKENFPDFDKYEIGTVMWLKSGHQCHVIQKTNDTFTIDCNPPLAGPYQFCQCFDQITRQVFLLSISISPFCGPVTLPFSHRS